MHNDDRLDFFREPDNRYNKQAIAIKTVDGVRIGYVPKQDNICSIDGCWKAPFREDYFI